MKAGCTLSTAELWLNSWVKLSFAGSFLVSPGAAQLRQLVQHQVCTRPGAIGGQRWPRQICFFLGYTICGHLHLKHVHYNYNCARLVSFASTFVSLHSSLIYMHLHIVNYQHKVVRMIRDCVVTSTVLYLQVYDMEIHFRIVVMDALFRRVDSMCNAHLISISLLFGLFGGRVWTVLFACGCCAAYPNLTLLCFQCQREFRCSHGQNMLFVICLTLIFWHYPNMATGC